MKILLVEDQVELSENIKSYFAKEGDVCESADTVSKAMEKLHSFEYDVLLLDLMLPDGNGIDLLRAVKQNWLDMGVVIISAKNALDDKLEGLNLGADDYLPKPFHLAELNARAKAVYRRRHQLGVDLLTFEEITIDLQAQEAKVNDVLLDLTRKEYELLHYFITNQRYPYNLPTSVPQWLAWSKVCFDS